MLTIQINNTLKINTKVCQTQVKGPREDGNVNYKAKMIAQNYIASTSILTYTQMGKNWVN